MCGAAARPARFYWCIGASEPGVWRRFSPSFPPLTLPPPSTRSPISSCESTSPRSWTTPFAAFTETRPLASWWVRKSSDSTWCESVTSSVPPRRRGSIPYIRPPIARPASSERDTKYAPALPSTAPTPSVLILDMVWASPARPISTPKLGQHLVAVDVERRMRIGAGDVHQRDNGRAKLLERLDPLHVMRRIGRRDHLLREHLVGHLVLAVAVDLLRLVDVVRVVLVDERPLPLPRRLERLVVRGRIGEDALEDDLPRLPPGFLARVFLPVDQLRRGFRVAERPDPVGEAPGEVRRALVEGREVHRR